MNTINERLHNLTGAQTAAEHDAFYDALARLPARAAMLEIEAAANAYVAAAIDAAFLLGWQAAHDPAAWLLTAE